MKEKVLIISNVTNGLFLFRRELVETLINDYEVIILAGDTGRVDDFRNMGCKVILTDIERHGTNPLKEMQLLRCYKKIIKKINPIIVFTYTIKPNIYGGMACASLGVPYVANITGLGTAVENKGFLQIITLFLLKRGLRKAQKVFFQNSSNRDFLIKHKVIRGEYDLLPGSGVNLERFPLLDYPNSETIEFAFISRIIKEKGIDQYLDAARFVKSKYPFTRFHICGDVGKAYSEIIDKLTKDGTIIYHGKVNDVVEIHRISSCTIHPSYYPEGMSNVILESAACGRPVITTDRAGCREAVDDGITGYIVKPKDCQELKNSIERFLQLNWEERKQMGVLGRLKVEKEFDRNIVIQKYISEIERLRGG